MNLIRQVHPGRIQGLMAGPKALLPTAPLATALLAATLLLAPAAWAQTPAKPAAAQPAAPAASDPKAVPDCIAIYNSATAGKVTQEQLVKLNKDLNTCRVSECERRNALLPKNRKPSDPQPEFCQRYLF